MSHEVASKESNHPLSSVGDHAMGTPVVIDLGKRNPKLVKQLRKGKPGKLLAEVVEAIDVLREQNAILPDAQTIIVVVREKRRASLLGF